MTLHLNTPLFVNCGSYSGGTEHPKIQVDITYAMKNCCFIEFSLFFSVPGGTLKRKKKSPEAEVLEYARQISDAVLYMHERNIFHCGNFLI